MKYNRKNRAIVFGILVGLASIYALASYFNLDSGQLGEFLLGTVLFCAGIVLLAVCVIVLFKLPGVLLRARQRKQNTNPEQRPEQEKDEI